MESGYYGPVTPMFERLLIYTDGAVEPNPGHARIGVVFFDEDGEELARLHEYISETTNKIADLRRDGRDLGKLILDTSPTLATDQHQYNTYLLLSTRRLLQVAVDDHDTSSLETRTIRGSPFE